MKRKGPLRFVPDITNRFRREGRDSSLLMRGLLYLLTIPRMIVGSDRALDIVDF
jgi:hypothetical protein